MKILFDHQIFSIQKYGGASKYFCELLKRLPRAYWDTTTLFSINEYIKTARLFSFFDLVPDHYFKGKAMLMNNLNKIYSYYRLKYDNYDIFHQTHFGNYCLKVIKQKKMVTTFHDINHSKYPDLYPKKMFINLKRITSLQKKSLDRADVVIAVSHNTKKDLIDLWNLKPEKIVVIHHGIDKNKIENSGNKRITPNPFVLFVGSRYSFKNFDRAALAFSIVSKDHPELNLICTGSRFSNEEIKRLSQLKIINKTIQVCADEQMMATLYSDATMFIYPSLNEGFGMPILEAMLYGCPVLLSNTGSFPEIAGNAGVYFDPYNVDDIAEAIKLLLEQTKLREEKINLGYEQLKLFSWEKTAEEHLMVYNSLI